MKLRVPDYYNEFRCLANKCKHTCCIGWEIDIDEDTYEHYQMVEGEFGERLKKNMNTGKEHYFKLQEGRCPFLNKKNLCDIILELGEEALSEVCTQYPRFTLEYGNVMEKYMALSCEEVGRLVFESEKPFAYVEMESEELSEDCDVEMKSEESAAYMNQDLDEEKVTSDEIVSAVEKAREVVFEIVGCRDVTIEQRLCQCLNFSEQVQLRINRQEYGEVLRFAKSWKEENQYITIHRNQTESSQQSYFEARVKYLEEMEVIDEEWEAALGHMTNKLSHEEISPEEYDKLREKFMTYYRSREYEYEKLIDYFVFRYLMRSVYDYDFLGKMKLAIVSFLCIRDLDMVRFSDQNETFTLEDRIDIARIYSKEVEHSEDNLEYLHELFGFEAIFEVEALMEQL